ncbi:MAG: hypothetical protein ACTSP3_02000 [Candidatus Heimdallarchaeaceae archaeon]
MWVFLIEEFPDVLDLCLKVKRKQLSLDLGTKLGIEIKDFQLPEELKVILNNFEDKVKGLNFKEDNPVYWFFKSLFQTIESFKIGKKRNSDKYQLLIIVKGPSELEVLSLIFDKFYSQKIPNWRNRLCLLPLEGTSKIKLWTSPNQVDLSKLSNKTIVLLDNDKKDEKSKIPKVNLEIIKQISEKKGTTFMFRKREIENYVHPQL